MLAKKRDNRRSILMDPIMVGVLSVLVGGAFGQSGGFGSIAPVSVHDPLYPPSAQFPNGQLWIPTTKVDYAWTLVGYDPDNPPQVDLTDPNRIIAIIDTGIDLDHIEFGGPPGAPGSKISTESTSFLEDGYTSGNPIIWCDCEVALFENQGPEDTMSLLVSGADPHGTIVAGIAGAYTNDFGMAGVCWDCGLLIIRVLAFSEQDNCSAPNESHFGTLCQQSANTMAAAIRHAAGWDEDTGQYLPKPRARIISISANSQGGYAGLACDGHIIADAIDEAYAQGCIIVSLAGNSQGTTACWEPAPGDPRCTPIENWNPTEISGGISINPKTIAVGGACVGGEEWHCRSSVNPLRSNTIFEDCCPAPDGVDYCDLAYPDPLGSPLRLPVLSVVAPMAHIFGTWADGVVEASNNDFGMPADGTSFATPQVAGIIALMLKVNPSLTFEDVKYILEVTATDIRHPYDAEHYGYDMYTGHGLVNARKAVEFAQKIVFPADWNGDGSVGPLDPVLYIADFVTGEMTADLDLDADQTTDDMTIFLDSYAGN
jgi:subtilisin family serine protease